MKNIVIYWDAFRGKEDNLLSFVGSKKEVYLEFFNAIAKDNHLYLSFGPGSLQPGFRFEKCHKYSAGNFEYQDGVVQADAVFDRSRGLSFPEDKDLENSKVLNCQSFKRLAGDKWEFYQNFSDYSPVTYLANNPEELSGELSKFSDTDRVVIKPRTGLKGEGITIDFKKNITPKDVQNYPVLVQEFSETKGGNLSAGRRNDLRVVIIDGEPIYAAVRTPKEGSLLANVARGGSIEQVSLNSLPKEVLEIVSSLGREIKQKYNNPFYSIDFGITEKGPVIFELNNFIGFPRINKKDQDRFVENLARVLSEKASDEV